MGKKMNFSGLNNQFKDSMATKEAYSSASGNTASKLFDNKVFKDVQFLKMKKDESYTIRFVPYEVDKTHPKVQEGKLEDGDYAYVLDYTQHAIGANSTRVICPRGTFGHPCPVCDKAFALRKDGASKEELDALKASRRVMYNIVLANDPSKLYLLSESHFLFEKELLAELSKGDDEGNPYNIADFCVGVTEGTKDSPLRAIKVMVTADKFGGREFNRYSFRVVKYNGEVDEDVLDEAIPLHKALVELKPSELEGILYGDESSSAADEDDDMDDIPVVIGNPNTAPIGKSDDDEEVIPKKKAEAEDANTECPSGYEFGGRSAGLEDECDDCPLYEACRAEKKRRKSLGR